MTEQPPPPNTPDAPHPDPTPPAAPASRPAGPWYTQGAPESIWYFVGATFAFAASTFATTGAVPVLPWILVAVGVLAIAVGIVVFTRPLRRPADPESESRKSV